ncbi:Cytochrome c oxidase subunit 6a [Nymphaea thermarum]|nr:Cytochrome c oxidase subunit 6a [Nymphaea thermarum]
MAQPAVRSGLKSLLHLRGTILHRSSARNPHRKFSSAAHHDDLHETTKWEKITYGGIATCAVLAFYNLSKGHHHQESPPVSFYCSTTSWPRLVSYFVLLLRIPYPYLHIRNKEFPWGPDGLFEEKHAEH